MCFIIHALAFYFFSIDRCGEISKKMRGDKRVIKIKKITVSLIMCLVLLVTIVPVVAAESDELGLEEAIEMVLEQNLELKLEKLNLEKEKL